MLTKFKLLWVFILIITLSLGTLIFHNSLFGDRLIYFIANTQLQLHKQLNQQVMLIAEQPHNYGISLIVISFIYGVFHAVGPGHGKAIIVSYLASNPLSKLNSCSLALAAAIVQALTAILLVTSVSLVLKFQYSQLAISAGQFSLLGYSLLLALGIFIALRSSYQLYKIKNDQNSCSSCCASANLKVVDKSLYQQCLLVISIGLRPCSGALIILVTSAMLGIFHYGVLGTLAMSLGTAVCTCIIALASLYARDLLNKTLLLYKGNHKRQPYGLYIQFIGSIVIILLAYSLINANKILTNPIL
jgi:ABC-type nickel/cobalt efflux system permease component RcnA